MCELQRSGQFADNSVWSLLRVSQMVRFAIVYSFNVEVPSGNDLLVEVRGPSPTGFEEPPRTSK